MADLPEEAVESSTDGSDDDGHEEAQTIAAETAAEACPSSGSAECVTSRSEPVAERSNWGLFDRIVSIVRETGERSCTYKSLVYHCAGQTVEFRKPLEGVGTSLMHGDFARKLSPSEEALALYIIKHPRLFNGRRVLDVGAGLGFAGLVCAACTQSAYLELSDGDPEVVSTLRTSVQLNFKSFGNTKVVVRKALWDRCEDWSERASFDMVVAADVVYLEFLHAPLLAMIARVLRPGGLFILFASRRNGSLEKFIFAAKAFFPSVEPTTDYDADVARAIGRNAKCFPVMVRMQNAASEELPRAVKQLCQELQARREEREREAKEQERAQRRLRAQHRARSASLLEHRKLRLEQKQVEEEERAAAQAAAAAAEAAAASNAKPRAPTISHAEQEGRSDWGLFMRDCITSEDGSHKDMVYDIGGRSVTIRRRGGHAKLSPSEEVLAMWTMKRRKNFKRKRVLELGAGLGLAGLVAATWTTAKLVEITDGDPSALALLEDNVSLNCESFTARKVRAQSLAWGEVPDGMKPFDWILAADVLDGSNSPLVRTLRRLLKPSGTAVVFLSAQGACLNSFVAEAKSLFDRVEVTRHYDEEVTRAFEGMSCFPRMVRLQRIAPSGKVASHPAQTDRVPSAAEVIVDPEVAGLVAAAGEIAEEAESLGKVQAQASQNRATHRRSAMEQSERGRRSRAASRGPCTPLAFANTDSAAPSQDSAVHTEGDTNTSEEIAVSMMTPSLPSVESPGRLPSLAHSRSNSARSTLAAAEASSAVHAGPRKADVASPTISRNALSATVVSRSASCAAVERAEPNTTSFWAQVHGSFSLGGFSLGGDAEGSLGIQSGSCSRGAAAAWRSQRSKSMPPNKAEAPAGLLELSVQGSGIVPASRCAWPSAVRSCRMSRSGLPRAPVPCA